MNANMMDFPLTLSHVLDRAGRLFGASEIVSRLPDKSLHRYTYRDFHQRALALGGGAILTSLVLGSLAVFLIERQFAMAAAFALVGAVMTFFGFMHGEHIGFAQSPAVAMSYVLVAGVLFACRYATAAPKPVEHHAPDVGVPGVVKA